MEYFDISRGRGWFVTWKLLVQLQTHYDILSFGWHEAFATAPIDLKLKIILKQICKITSIQLNIW